MSAPEPVREPIKVTHVIVGLDVGGAETNLRRLIESHRTDRSIAHRVISLTGTGAIGRQIEALGVRVEALGMNRSVAGLYRAFKLASLLRHHSPDVVQTWMYHADLLGGLAARAGTDAAVVWNVRCTKLPHGLLSPTGLLAMACGALSRLLPDRIVCVAESARREHLRLGYARDRIEVIPNGIDVPHFDIGGMRDDARAELAISPDEAVVGFVGRFDVLKDIPNFVSAAAHARKSVPNLRVLMVGRGMDLSNESLTAALDLHGLLQTAILLGERSDIRPALAAIDVFCLSSRSEGFPNALAEAMASGVPAVATDVGDARIMLEPIAPVVPLGNSEALGEALVDVLLSTASQRAETGGLLQQRVSDRYALPNVAQQYRGLYARLASK